MHAVPQHLQHQRYIMRKTRIGDGGGMHLVRVERHASLELEEEGIDLRAHAALHAAQLLHTVAAAAAAAVAVAQALQHSIARVVLENLKHNKNNVAQ